MRKNRKRSRKMSVMASRSMHVGAVMVMLFVMVILNLLASSSCTQLMKSIGEKEKTIAKLDNDFTRESARWDGMKTAEGINAALKRFGLSMAYPKPNQVVRMDAHGRPKPGQMSVVNAKRRASGGVTARVRRLR